MPGQPALGGVALAVLLLRPVLRGDELRRQRQDLLVARCDQGGAQEGVEVFRAAIGAAARRALAAFDLARAEILAAVERDQHPPTQALEACQWPGCLDRPQEQMVECRRRGAVQHQADVVVGRDRRHAEQGLAIRPALATGQRPLMCQERRASHEEHREGREADVGHRVLVITTRSVTPVGKTCACRAQFGDQFLDDDHTNVESRRTSRCTTKLTACCSYSSDYPQYVANRTHLRAGARAPPATRHDRHPPASERNSIALRTACLGVHAWTA